MKIREITFSEMKKNMKGNSKPMISILAVCVAIGIVCGLMSAKSYDPEEVANASQLQEHVDLDSIKKDGGYYYNCLLELKEKKDYIDAYLQYFEQVDISNESREKLSDVEDEIDAYQDVYDEAKAFYEEKAPVLEGEEEDAIAFYEEKIEELQEEQEEKEAELDEVVNGRYTDDYKELQQKNISDDLLKIKKDKDIFQGQIDAIDSFPATTLEHNAAAFDVMLAADSAQLNNIVDHFNDTLTAIAEKENYEIIYNKRLINEYFEEAGFDGEMEQEEILSNQKGKAIAYAQSIAGLDVPKERFFATFTFFLLFGLALALIIGAVYTPKGEK